MAGCLKLTGFLLLAFTMATGAQQLITIDTLAQINRDLLESTIGFFNQSMSAEMSRWFEHLSALDARVDDLEGRLRDYDFKIPPIELASPCDAERALVRLNSSLSSWYESLSVRLAAIEQVMEFITISDSNAARTGNQNEEPKVPADPEPEPSTTTKRPKTTRRTTRAPTTRRPTTTTRPPTTTTMPTTTPTTTMAPTTTPLPTPFTCAELAQRGETVPGRYLIDPTGTGNPFYADCEFPTGEAGITSIGHSVDDDYVLNNGFEAPASFSLGPVYDASIDQMKALTAASQSCSQFIKYRCRAAVLLAEDNKTRMKFGYWVSVDGEQINSWGGAPINSGMCACAVETGSCPGGKKCNCDSNPKEWSIDEGLITDKPYLPVTDIRLGDTGSKKEMGQVTLGPLRCQG